MTTNNYDLWSNCYALLDNTSATTLHWKLLRFFSQIHRLDLLEGKMESIPTQLLVDEPILNSKSSSIDCNSIKVPEKHNNLPGTRTSFQRYFHIIYK
jgi:hypothetical protein